ncbi:MAG TPA: ABC transporter permease subunit [Candidatus Acidoferrum sp.]|nr:ABC transporter permease subunit [Candidatus Acidoferrum sp.]
MRLFPIVTREMRVASRKGVTYWNRAAVALGAILVAMFALLVLARGSPQNTGFMMFVWMAVIAYAHCLLTGLVLTADCLAEEKRDGTLGLLFLTDLKGYDVVFGKLFASSLRGVYGLLAIFPVLGICLLLGGVTPAEFARVMLTCLNHLFLSLSIGMMASALCRDERKALALAFFIVLVLTAGFPALGGWIMWKMHLNKPPFFPFGFSPGFASFLAFDKTFAAIARNMFYEAIVTQHLMGWVALIVACRIVPLSWQDKIASASSAKRSATWRQWIYGPPSVRVAFRRRLLDINPYYWLVSRDRFKQTMPWLWLSLAGSIWLIGLMKWPKDFREEGMYVMTALSLHTLFKAWIAFEASRHLGGDRQSGALELLLCTPISVHEILRGQWLGVLRQFGPAALVVCMADVIFLIAGWPFSKKDQVEWFLVWTAGISIFVLDLITLSWTAMWLGLLRKRTGQGGVHALVRICLVPWILFAVLTAILAALDEWRIIRMNKVSDWMLPFWWMISAGISIFFGWGAYKQLHQNLRAVAAERFVGRGAAWGRALGRAFNRARTGSLTPPPAGPAADAGASALR